jgi:hypothetical protein
MKKFAERKPVMYIVIVPDNVKQTLMSQFSKILYDLDQYLDTMSKKVKRKQRKSPDDIKRYKIDIYFGTYKLGTKRVSVNDVLAVIRACKQRIESGKQTNFCISYFSPKDEATYQIVIGDRLWDRLDEKELFRSYIRQFQTTSKHKILVKSCVAPELMEVTENTYEFIANEHLYNIAVSQGWTDCVYEHELQFIYDNPYKLEISKNTLIKPELRRKMHRFSIKRWQPLSKARFAIS